jgi:hypothetical protein
MFQLFIIMAQGGDKAKTHWSLPLRQINPLLNDSVGVHGWISECRAREPLKAT